MVIDLSNPALSLFIFSSLLALLITIINRLAMGKDFLDNVKRRMEELREGMLEAQRKGEKEKVEKLMEDMLKVNTEYMKKSLKPLLISSVLILLFFPLLQQRYTGKMISLPVSIPLFGGSVNWYIWYFMVSLAISWMIRKFLEE